MSIKPKKVYMIRDSNTGLYSTGGYNPSFTKKGKVWNSSGAIKNHLRLFDVTFYSSDIGDIINSPSILQIQRKYKQLLEIYTQKEILTALQKALDDGKRRVYISATPTNWEIIELIVPPPVEDSSLSIENFMGRIKTE